MTEDFSQTDSGNVPEEQVEAAVHDPARLAALERAALLDSPPEEEFDRLTRLAQKTLQVPVTLISLVDEDRQFFKSSCGLPEFWATKRQTPLSQSFCQHVVASRTPFVVEDSLSDPRVCHNLARRAMGVGAYLGSPLMTREGHVLGAFCAIDTKPHAWTEEDIAVLADFAALAMILIEWRSASRSSTAQ